MNLKILFGFELFMTDIAYFYPILRRVDVGYVLFQVTVVAVHFPALGAYWLQGRHGRRALIVTGKVSSSTSAIRRRRRHPAGPWNPISQFQVNSVNTYNIKLCPVVHAPKTAAQPRLSNLNAISKLWKLLACISSKLLQSTYDENITQIRVLDDIFLVPK